MENYIFINFQNGNGNINKQFRGTSKTEELEVKIQRLTEELIELKKAVFTKQNDIGTNKYFPHLSKEQLN